MAGYLGTRIVNLSTTAADVTGNATIGGNLTVSGTTITIDSATAQTVDLGDGDKIRLGDGDDLQIYHDGSNSYVDDTGTGALILRGNSNVTIGKYTGETMGYFEADGAAYLYHDNAIKFQTSSTGVTVGPRTLTVDGVAASDSPRLNLDLDGTNKASILLNRTTEDLQLTVVGSNNMTFTTNSSEAMRIDSSGNLLVSKASADTNTVGAELRSNGKLVSTMDGGNSTFNRKTSDGEIVKFQKDGSTVGSIGNASTTLDVSATGEFMQFTTANNQIAFGSSSTPALAGNGSSNDAAIDLGRSNRRWRNLYLSGGAYIGGTGSANYLEDYEEGTFTATWIGTGTSGPSSTLKYTKIGNTVHIFGNTVSTIPTPTGSIELSGLPFTPSEDSTGSILYRNVTASSGQHTLNAFVPSGTSNLQLYWSAQGSYAKLQKSQINASGSQDMYFGVTYMTS